MRWQGDSAGSLGQDMMKGRLKSFNNNQLIQNDVSEPCCPDKSLHTYNLALSLRVEQWVAILYFLDPLK